ncbi:MAG: hypothetical protein U9O65_02105 [Thermotogota bacterium]|nr:hypothetical protein [Thermotogota bacterium]
MEWLLANWVGIGIALGALDILIGALPDKISKYPGGILSVAHKLYEYGKEQR